MAELRADPDLAPVLDSPRVQKALQEVQKDPARALATYANDRVVRLPAGWGERHTRRRVHG